MKYLEHVMEQNMRILIAEDDPHLGPSLKKGLEDSHYAVDLYTLERQILKKCCYIYEGITFYEANQYSQKQGECDGRTAKSTTYNENCPDITASTYFQSQFVIYESAVAVERITLFRKSIVTFATLSRYHLSLRWYPEADRSAILQPLSNRIYW